MLYETIMLPSSGQTQCALDCYVPDLTHSDKEDLRRPAVVVCGGGGYQYVSNRETEPVALRFVTLGFNAFVIHYRVAPNVFPAGLHDIAAAVAYVRAHAAQLHTDPDRIAVMGFSAGAHAAGSLGVMWNRPDLFDAIGCSAQQVRPNAMVLCYPVITGGEFAHRGSFVNLTGSQDHGVHEQYSLDALVTPDVPPTFLFHTWEDGAVPVENSLMMAAALRRSGVLTEMHIYPRGGHGLSLANGLTSGGNPQAENQAVAAWPELAARFLREIM